MALKSMNTLKSMVKEPQNLYKWEIRIPTWPSAATPDNPDMLFFVQSSDLPTPEYENNQVQLGGFTFNFDAGRENRNGEIAWTFVENTRSDVIHYFDETYSNARQKRSVDDGASMSSASTDELTAPVVVMTMYALDGKTVTRRINLVNVLFKINDLGGQLAQDTANMMPVIGVMFDDWHTEKA